MGMLGQAMGRRGGHTQYWAELRCDDRRCGVRRAQLRTVGSRGDHLVVFVLGVLVLRPLTFEPFEHKGSIASVKVIWQPILKPTVYECVC